MATNDKKDFRPGVPVLTIISVTYNAEHYLEQTLLSIVKQTFQNIELIIIDGGSTDGTLDIIKKYEKHISYWVSEPDKGIYDAMNKACKVATGDWVNFIGAGDILLNVLHKVVPLFTDKNTIYYGNVYRNDTLEVFNGRYNAFKFSRVAICHQAIWYPLSVCKEYKYELKYRCNADHHLNILLYGNKKYSWQYFPAVVCVYEGGGFSDVNIDIEFAKDRVSVVKKNMPFAVYLYALARNTIWKMLNKKLLK